MIDLLLDGVWRGSFATANSGRYDTFTWRPERMNLGSLMPGRHALRLQVAAGDGSSAGVNLNVLRLFRERPAFLPLLHEQ